MLTRKCIYVREICRSFVSLIGVTLYADPRGPTQKLPHKTLILEVTAKPTLQHERY